MDEELLINVSGFETRVALVQNHALAEVHLQRSGPIASPATSTKGRANFAGMQAAFVNIGLGVPDLHARDIDAPRISVAELDPVQKTFATRARRSVIARAGARPDRDQRGASDDEHRARQPLSGVDAAQCPRWDIATHRRTAERERLRLATETARVARLRCTRAIHHPYRRGEALPTR
jgi:hypothetical protein